MTIHDWEQWRKDNPDWEKDWSKTMCIQVLQEVGEWKNKLS